MVNVVIAPDKFKGSLTAKEVCETISNALLEKYPDARIVSIPLADGGEGTTEVLSTFFNCTPVTAIVQNPLSDLIQSVYAYSEVNKTAVIEMASASGLQLIPQDKRNPMYTTTYGTGQLIADALERGARKIILGIGGSATNDGGMGMAAALGFTFLNKKGQPITPVGENLIHLDNILLKKVHPRLNEVEFVTLCDVYNPLHGRDGAAYVYGPQKGASKEEILLLAEGLKNYERVIQKVFNTLANFPGAGAAGGLGAGAKVFLKSEIKRGIDFIIEATSLEKKIQEADLVITGEGKVDHQSLSGKVVLQVNQLASRYAKPVVVVCGKCELTQDQLQQSGIKACIALADGKTSVQEAMTNTSALLKEKIKMHINLNM